jgi:hypothetical protein
MKILGYGDVKWIEIAEKLVNSIPEFPQTLL